LFFLRHLVSVKLDQERVEVSDFLARRAPVRLPHAAAVLPRRLCLWWPWPRPEASSRGPCNTAGLALFCRQLNGVVADRTLNWRIRSAMPNEIRTKASELGDNTPTEVLAKEHIANLEQIVYIAPYCRSSLPNPVL